MLSCFVGGCCAKFETGQTFEPATPYISFILDKWKQFRQHAELMEQFVTDLKLLARGCAFRTQDEKIRDRILFGTNSHKIRGKADKRRQSY